MNNSINLFNNEPTSMIRKTIFNKEQNGISDRLGNIITATITSKDIEKTTLKTKDNFEFTSKSNNINGNVGDELTFEVIKKDNQISLRQILNTQESFSKGAIKQHSISDLKELFKQSNFIEDEDKSKEEKLKIDNALTKIKRQLSYSSDNLTSSAYAELVRSGISLEKISIPMLSTAMSEIDNNKKINVSEDELSEIKSQFYKNNNEFEKNKETDKSIKTLIENDLPLTKRNVQSISNLIKTVENIENPDERSILNLINEEKELTPENIYLSKFKAKPLEENLPQDIWSKLKPQVEEMFNRDGIEKTKTSFNIAKMFIENETSITKENVDKFLFLKDLKENVNLEDVLQKSINNIKTGENVDLLENLSTPSFNSSLFEKFEGIIEVLPAIKDENIETLLKNNLPITLENLALSTRNKLENIPIEISNTQQSIVSIKRQLAEIQLKLTQESAFRLANKNIEINTMPIKQALDALKAEEQEMYAKSLKMMGATPSSDNVTKMNELFTKIEESKNLTYNVYNQIFNKKVDFTINAIHKSVSTDRLSDYETFATVPNSKFGDSFAKVRQQIAPLLESLEIEPTEQNIRATAIISKNNIDLTEETLMQIKQIDERINNIYNRLHPTIASTIIKDGLNPLEMHIDELKAYIDKFDNLFGKDIGDKISTYILQMEESNSITEEEKKSMVAIYRTLNNIMKDGSNGVGIAFKNNANLTLGNLLEASKYFQNTKGKKSEFDISIDDRFGALENLKISENNIKNILDNAYEKATSSLSELEKQKINEVLDKTISGETFENIEIAKHLLNTDNLTPKTFNELSNKLTSLKQLAENANPDLLQQALEHENESIEKLINDFKLNSNISEQDFNIPVKELQNILQTSPVLVNWLSEHNILQNKNNISILHNMTKDPFYLGKLMDKLSESKKIDLNNILDTDLSLLEKKNHDEILEDLSKEMYNASKETVNSKLIKEFELARNSIQLQRFIAKSPSNEIKLPIKLHNKLSSLNMLILNNDFKADNANVLVALQTKSLGTVQVNIKTNENNVTLNINSNYSDAVKHLKDNVNSLIANLENNGFNVTNINFGTEEERNSLEKSIFKRGL